MPDVIEKPSPDLHICGICERTWTAHNPNRLTDNGKPICTLCLTEMVGDLQEWEREHEWE